MPAKQEPNIGINYGWAGGESGINLQLDENWRAIGALLQLSVISKTIDVPATPVAGDRYIVPPAATGAWTGHDGKIARYNEGVWELYTPLNGWNAYVADEELFNHFDGSLWNPAPYSTASNNSFDPAGSSLTQTNTQDAINELDGKVAAGGVADGGITTSKLSNYATDTGTTTGLTFGYKAGALRVGSSVVTTAAGTVTLTASATNYVEVDDQGVVSVNTVGYTSGRLPIYRLTTDASTILTNLDNRTWLSIPDTPSGAETVYAATSDLNAVNGGIQTYTMVADTTFTITMSEGQHVAFHLSGGDTYSATWPTLTWVGGVAPTLTADDVIEFWKVGTTIYGAYVGSVA